MFWKNKFQIEKQFYECQQQKFRTVLVWSYMISEMKLIVFTTSKINKPWDKFFDFSSMFYIE